MEACTIWTLTLLMAVLTLVYICLLKPQNQTTLCQTECPSLSVFTWKLLELPFLAWPRACRFMKCYGTIWIWRTFGTRFTHSMIGSLPDGQRIGGPAQLQYLNCLRLMAWVYTNLKYISVANKCLIKVIERLGLSFCNIRELNHIVDDEMPEPPRFKCEVICLGGESFDFHFQEVIPCIRTLFGDPNFARRLALVPECHYLNEDHTKRVFKEMHTRKWWWSVQVRPISSVHRLLCAHSL